jgi:DNA polymerase-3 subunit gamma/tau
MRSIRIKRSANTPEEAEAATRSEQQKNSVLENKTFDEDTLKRAWMDFADTIEEDIHLSNALKMLQPLVRPEHRVEVLVSNQVVQRKLEQLQMELLNHLRGKLRNSLIQLDILLDEREETFKPFTAREKFDVMAKKNPNLLLLYKTFGLDIH